MENDAEHVTLQILERLAANPGYSATVPNEEFHLFEGLEASGFIFGQIGPDTHDAPQTMVEGVKLTATGRQHLRDLRQSLHSTEEKFVGDGPTADSVLTNFAAGIIADCYTGNELVRATCAWALDCNVENLPFALTPIPPPITKRQALERNLTAFTPAVRFRIIEDLVSKVRSDKANFVKDLSTRLQALRASAKSLADQSAPKRSALPDGRSDLFAAALSDTAYEFLDSIWENFRARREWPTTWLIHSRLGKPRVAASRAELGSNRVIENPSSQGSIYQLLIGGVLLTKHSVRVEHLLVQYIDFLRDRYKNTPQDRVVVSADVRARMGLSVEDTAFLGDLVFIAGFFGSGSNGPAEWSATTPTEIEDCSPDMSSKDFLRQMITKRNTPNLPVELGDRLHEISTSQHEFTMPSVPAYDRRERLYQVFVSSTFTDLKDERHEVMMALLQTKCIPVGMERFPATDADQMAYIRPVIDNCDYYIVILAGRYGSVPDGKSVSYTEMEFDYAVSKKKYAIVMCHSDVGKIPMNLSEKSDTGRQRLEAFYDKVRKGRICDHWSSAHELASKVKTAIYDAIENHPQEGWVRAATIASAAERKAPVSMPNVVPMKLVNVTVRISYRLKGAKPSDLVQTAEFDAKRSIDQLVLLLARRLEKPSTAISLKGSFERAITPSLVSQVTSQNGGIEVELDGNCSIKSAQFQRVIDALNAEDLIHWKAAPRNDKNQTARWVISKTGVKRLSRLRANGESSSD